MWREGEVERRGRRRIWRELGEGGGSSVREGGSGGVGREGGGGVDLGFSVGGGGYIGRGGAGWATGPIMLRRGPNNWLSTKNFSKTFFN
jgi:hypothetical protein